MKKSSFLTLFAVSALAMGATSCHNGDVDFPDYDFSAAYFAYQTPVRTIVMGEDTYDTTLDNEHKFEVYATLAGMYDNENRVEISIEVDESLCDNLYFDADLLEPVKPLPSSYYTLSSDKIVLDKVLYAGVEVELAEAFFDDADAIKNTYVLPLRMTNATNIDSILMGTPKVDFDSAISQNAEDWDTLPLDYTLYCVKYINPWCAYYLRRGVDYIDNNGVETTNTRKEEYVESDEVVYTSMVDKYTVDMDISIPVVNADETTTTYQLTITLTFDESTYTNSDCVVSYTGSESYTVSGTGEYVIDGEQNSWGNVDRDAIYLEYEVDLGNGVTASIEDIMVIRNRGVALETFTPTYSE